jgi:hypothetical protein
MPETSTLILGTENINIAIHPDHKRDNLAARYMVISQYASGAVYPDNIQSLLDAK